MEDAYKRLRKVGLRVSIPRGFSFDAAAPPAVARTSPPGGSRVAADSVVTLYLSCCRRPARSRTAPGRVRRFRVAKLVGGLAGGVSSWAAARRLDFTARLGPLRAGAETGLLANYVIARQHPAAGTWIEGGHGRTPPGRLTVWAAQPPPCTPRPGDKLVTRSATAVITSRKSTIQKQLPEITWYGCLKASGEWRVLTSGGNGGANGTVTVQQVRLAGRFVAFAFVDWFGKAAGCGSRAAIFDLQIGSGGTVFSNECVGSSAPTKIDSLRLQSNGFAAWHTEGVLASTAFTGLSCPSVSLCVATDIAGNVLTSTDPLAGRQTWSIAHVAGYPLTGVSCPTVNLCATNDMTAIYTSTDPTAGAAAWNATKLAATAPRAISCPSTALCVALGLKDRVDSVLTSTAPTAGAAAWTASPLPPFSWSGALDCPTIALCIAGGSGGPNGLAGRLLTSTNPTGGTSAWTVTAVPALSVVAVSCPSASACFAGTNLGGLLASTNPTGGASAWTVAQPSLGSGPLSCPSLTLCVSGTSPGSIVTSTDPIGGHWSVSAIPTTSSLAALSCPTASVCVAGDTVGQILVSANPAGGGSTWSSSLVDAPGACTFMPCRTEHVYAYDTAGTHTLDSAYGGTGHTLAQLALSGNLLSWTNAGVAHQATLR